LQISRYLIVLAALVPGLFSAAWGAESNKEFDSDELYARIIIRTADQLAAFYHGREFSKAAIKEIQSVCFVTPILKNKKFEVMWINLDEWQFFVDEVEVKRLNRDFWKQRWQQINLPLRHQATFGWTLMPEKRDLRFDEGVGGSVVIPWQDKPFTLAIRLPIEHEDAKFVRELKFEGLKCSGD
jgi:hypothetical protein